MSDNYLFLGMIILGIGLTCLSLRITLLPFRIAASLSWLTLGILILLGDLGTSMSDSWTQVLGILFVVLTIVPILLQFVTEVKRERGGSFWTEWRRNKRKSDREARIEAADQYKKELRSLGGGGPRKRKK